jgi:hypothetical protein
VRDPTASPAGAHRVLDLSARAGEVLLSGGAGTSDVTATCVAIADPCGLYRLECDITFTSNSAAWQPSLDATPVSGMRLVRSRQARGVAPVEWNEKLAEVARSWSAEMAQRATLEHQDVRALLEGSRLPGFRSLGENIFRSVRPCPQD